MSEPCPTWWDKLQKDGTLSKNATAKEKRDYAAYQKNAKGGGQKKTAKTGKVKIDV